MNILVNSTCLLKLADFGLSKLCIGDNFSRIPPMTDYVTTRWYRAPEVLVGWPCYGYAIDLWALGTIIAELLLRQALFPGKDSVEQLEMVARHCGKPSRDFIDTCKKRHVRVFLESLPASGSPPTPPSSRQHLHARRQHRRQQHNQARLKEWSQSRSQRAGQERFRRCSKEVQDLLGRLLQMHPDDRFTAEEALGHPFLLRARELLPPHVARASPSSWPWHHESFGGTETGLSNGSERRQHKQRQDQNKHSPGSLLEARHLLFETRYPPRPRRSSLQLTAPPSSFTWQKRAQRLECKQETFSRQQEQQKQQKQQEQEQQQMVEEARRCEQEKMQELEELRAEILLEGKQPQGGS